LELIFFLPIRVSRTNVRTFTLQGYDNETLSWGFYDF